jgi:hypothetical protein
MMTIKELLKAKEDLEKAFAIFLESFEIDGNEELDISNLEFNLYEFKGVVEKFDEDLRDRT